MSEKNLSPGVRLGLFTLAIALLYASTQCAKNTDKHPQPDPPVHSMIQQ